MNKEESTMDVQMRKFRHNKTPIKVYTYAFHTDPGHVVRNGHDYIEFEQIKAQGLMYIKKSEIIGVQVIPTDTPK